jgi:soluble lytic murein transglycosylase-like protein
MKLPTQIAVGLMPVMILVGQFGNRWKIEERTDALAADLRSVRALLASEVEQRELSLKIQVMRSGIDPSLAAEIAETVLPLAKLHGRDPDLVLAIMYEESRFDPGARSSQDAIGLMQVRGLWAKGCDLVELECNVRRGLERLAFYEADYETLQLALIAYNRGPSPVENALTWRLDPGNGYAERVMRHYTKLKAMTGEAT